MEKWLPFANSIGLVLGIIYVISKEVRSGSNVITKQVTDAYKERNAQLDKDIQSLNDTVTLQGQQIAKLTGVIEEKDKHILSLTELVQGRNPEMLQLLKDMKILMTGLTEFMQTSHVQNSEVLKYQTEILEKIKGRGDKIDRASKRHKGVPMLIPEGTAPTRKKK